MTSIIIFSSNNKTKFISEIIQEKIYADIIEIKDLNKKRGFLGNIQNNYNALRSNKTNIQPERIDLQGYDLIIIGSPSTFGGISPAISTFIDNNSFKNKNIIMFTTTNSRQGYDVLKNMKKKLESKGGIIVNSFIMRVNNKSEDELKINTLKIIKDLDLDLYS
ncbi:MAG TPA: flavodoxin [Methanosphaera sp.]|nr:flavodoxin [Methanosphaera sp.]HIJ15539.1 flavodoxin [Methanosphaera sp.]